jgi:CheY-like chemotaxis protein
MTLSALLVCVDEKAAEVLRRVLKELSIRVESCPDLARAAMRTAQERFDVIVVDGDSGAEVTALLRETRLSRRNDATLAVAVVPSQETIRELFSLGVNFVLYKPVAYERALSSLRAARAVMRKEKRSKGRTSVHTHATVDYANVEQEKATLIDLADDGMAVLFGKRVPPTSKVYFQFKLPGQATSIRLSGVIVWQDWNGRAGVQFVDVPKTSRRLLQDFLSSNPASSEMRKELPDVTVEVEEPLVAVPAAPAPVSEKAHENARVQPSQQEAAAACIAAVQAEPDANNRRTKTRYACRLGAEVYLTGTSVPNHCCLTDLSSGGCYLEVPLPFPKGASIEILVRTYEMKLSLRGTVLASHPGFGMGIGFELKTKEEQANVQKLTDFVAATVEPS